MIINKSTSNELLADTLVVLGSAGLPIKKVIEFDTQSLLTTLSAGDPITATSFLFNASTIEDQNDLRELLDDEFEPRIIMNRGKKYKAKKAMTDVISSDDYLVFNSSEPSLQMNTATCTNCSTLFLLYLNSATGELWSAAAETGDTFQTLTQVSEVGLTCDNCGNEIVLLDENPW